MRGRLPHSAMLAGIALVTAAGGALALRAVGPDNTAEAGEGAVASAVRVSGTGDRTRIQVAPSVIEAGNLVVAPVVAVSVTRSRSGLATVLPLQTLLDQRRALATATAEARRASIATNAARLEARRLALLHADDRIASDKALEAQQAMAATEGAALANARAQSALAAAGARQQWGSVIGGWLVRDAAPLQSLFAGRTVLVQLSGVDLGPLAPRRAELVLPDGSRVKLTIVGPAAQADPKFQAAGFYALAPARPGLAPGVSVSVNLPGPTASGVAVPDDAIIRSDGRALVYVERRTGVFTPVPITTATRTATGWLATGGLQPGARVVVRGAQLLFSQQQRGAGAGGGE